MKTQSYPRKVTRVHDLRNMRGQALSSPLLRPKQRTCKNLIARYSYRNKKNFITGTGSWADRRGNSCSATPGLLGKMDTVPATRMYRTNKFGYQLDALSVVMVKYGFDYGREDWFSMLPLVNIKAYQVAIGRKTGDCFCFNGLTNIYLLDSTPEYFHLWSKQMQCEICGKSSISEIVTWLQVQLCKSW